MNSLIYSNFTGGVELSRDALAVRDGCMVLGTTRKVTEVQSPGQLFAAIEAGSLLQEWLNEVEQARLLVKSVPYALCQRIDKLHKEGIAPVVAEKARLQRLCDEYKATERKKQAAQVDYHNQCRQDAIMDAKTDEEREAAMRLPIAEMPEKGRKTKWEITDAHALYALHPEWFVLSPNKALINDSVTGDTVLPGLKCEWVESTIFRAPQKGDAAVKQLGY